MDYIIRYRQITNNINIVNIMNRNNCDPSLNHVGTLSCGIFYTTILRLYHGLGQLDETRKQLNSFIILCLIKHNCAHSHRVQYSIVWRDRSETADDDGEKKKTT